MNFYKKLMAISIAAVLCLAFSGTSLLAAEAGMMAKSSDTNKSVKIAVVDFKECVEKSKIGKQEQQNFEELKKQMEKVLGEREKTLTEFATKFNDMDYLDSISESAQADLRKQYRTLTQEYQQQQNQFYQNLSQTNLLVIQKLNDAVAKAAEKLAQDLGYDIVLNKEGCYFAAASLNISSQVIKVLDEAFDKESLKKDDKLAPAQK